jgi:uncharacterized protein YgfB (UPF0149 family)
MTRHTLPSFDDLTETLSHTDLKLHAAQVHGLISGVLCGNFNAESAWQELVMGEKLTDETQEDLQRLYLDTATLLSEFLFEFKMVLPDDDTSLAIRAEALTVWCQGFLTGLKVAGIPVVGREPSELTEAIDDLIEIAKMNYEQVEESEEDEESFAELAEYLRMAVIHIYTESHADALPNISAHRTHLH